MSTWLKQTLGVDLKLSPQMQLALKLLQFNQLELQDYVTQQLQENPFLEEAPVGPDDSHDDSRYISAAHADDDQPSFLDLVVNDDPSFEEHLLNQINATFTDSREHFIATELTSLLNDAGLLHYTPQMLATHFNVEEPLIKRVLSKLQQFDPHGVFALNIGDAFKLQLAEMNELTPLRAEILNQFKEALNTPQTLCKKLKVSKDELLKELFFISRHCTAPRQRYEDTPADNITPDFTVTKHGDELQLHLNKANIPNLDLSTPLYDQTKQQVQGEEKEFIQGYYNEAKWLMKQIQQRYNTLQKIGAVIVDVHKSYLLGTSPAPASLTLKEVATKADVHESTISRAISGKFMQTPLGTFNLKHFFNTSLGGSFENHSVAHVKKLIQDLIAKEDTPLSDEKIAQMLKGVGVNVARRTVAKYREQMNILPAYKRKLMVV